MKFICPKCGFQKNICIGDTTINDIEEFKCIFCKIFMVKEEDEIDSKTLANKVANQIIINSMKKGIEKSGNDKMWEMIENIFVKPEQRLRFRKYFFLAGGKMPTKTEESYEE